MDPDRIERWILSVGAALITAALWFIIYELGAIIFYLKEIEFAVSKLCLW